MSLSRSARAVGRIEQYAFDVRCRRYVPALHACRFVGGHACRCQAAAAAGKASETPRGLARIPHLLASVAQSPTLPLFATILLLIVFWLVQVMSHIYGMGS